MNLVEIRTVDLFKPGSYVFGIKGKDVFADVVIEKLEKQLYFWDGGVFSIIPPRVSFQGVRSIFQDLINSQIKNLGLIAYLPKTNSLNTLLPPIGKNYRIRKWYNKNSKELLFWVDIKSTNPNIFSYETAVQKVLSVFANVAPNKLKGTPLAPFDLVKMDIKIYQSKEQFVQINKPPTATNVKPVVVNITVPPANVGGGVTNYTTPDGQTAEVKPSQIAVDGFTNPWLWLAGGLTLFALTFVVKQLRGSARELGSGVRSTYDEARSGTDSLGADPVIPQRRK